MLLQVFLLASGIFLLLRGADWLIDGSVMTARALRVSNILIGLTVVACGTSAPELFVSSIAAFQQKADISIGNIIGSQIANIALVLGVAALIKQINISKVVLSVKFPILIGSAALLTILIWDLVLTRIDGYILITSFIVFMVYSIYHGTHIHKPKHEVIEANEPQLKDGLLIICGLAGITFGAHLLINSSIFLAKAIGISELVISITIVALGTSLPELATSIVALLKKEEDIGFANIIGSNIFNVLLIIGLAAIISPLAVSPIVKHIDIWIVNGFTLLLLLLCLNKYSLSRLKGAILLSSYSFYIAYLFIR